MRGSLTFAIGCLVVFLGVTPVASAEPATPEQRQQVEQIIHDYLLANPEFLIEVLKSADAKAKQKQQEQARAALREKREELLNDPSSPVGGNTKGDVTIVEFFDYQCPYCKQVEPSVQALIKEDAKLRIVYKEFPILGPMSIYASHVALAALKQSKYERFHAPMMSAKGPITEDSIMKIAAESGLDLVKLKLDMKAPELDVAIKRNYALADALSINGTPAFVIGDKLLPGAVDLATLKHALDEARKSR